MRAISKKKLTEIFTFLDELRESGVTNMFGSSLYVEEEFPIGHDAAVNAVCGWMRTFNADKPAEERATEHLKASK